MNAFGSYLLQMSCWIGGFWLVYIVFLRKETFFNLNRWFLNLGLIASLIMPLFPVRYAVQLEPKIPVDLSDLVNLATVVPSTESVQLNYWVLAYVLGAVLFRIQFLRQTAYLLRMKKKAEIVQIGQSTIFKIDVETAPFSFFSKIYVSKKLSGETELKAVIAHEKVHIEQRHWADLLLLEVVRALQWFNPLLVLYRKAMMQNHEYLADWGTLATGVSARTYQAILANQMLGVPILQIANGFTLFNPTKRILMMNKDKTKPIRQFKLLWAIPVVALILFSFSKPVYVTNSALSEGQVIEGKIIKVKGKVLSESGKPMHGASVIVAKSNYGTVVDPEGNFTLENVMEGAEVVISFVGYKTLRQEVAPQMGFVMQKEVRVVGYGPKKPSAKSAVDEVFVVLGSSHNESGGVAGEAAQPLVILDGEEYKGKIADIDPETIESISVLKDDASKTVYGKKGEDGVVVITSKEKKPVTIRGISNSSNPLVVIDGKITDKNAMQIDVDQIESINVLKDQSAIAKYGEKAKNGVIEVTTKKKPSVQPDPDEVFVVVEEIATFPGGKDALSVYLKNATEKSGIKGVVVPVYFTVNKTGVIENVRADESATKNARNKAAEIVKAMPKWNPAKQRGLAVDVDLSVEVVF
jgi:TonB-dependent SusC/RagA subfamily outer membrane receptor